MKKILKTIASFTVILLIISSFVFLCFEMYEHNHECDSNNCPICCELDVVKNVSKVKIKTSIIISLLALVFFDKVSCISNFYNLIKSNTLVSLKIELLN